MGNISFVPKPLIQRSIVCVHLLVQSCVLCICVLVGGVVLCTFWMYPIRLDSGKELCWSKISYRVLIKYCVFSLKFCDFSDLCQFYCSAGVLPAWCVYTHWHRGKTEKDQSPEYSKIFGKNTIFNKHPVSIFDFLKKLNFEKSPLIENNGFLLIKHNRTRWMKIIRYPLFKINRILFTIYHNVRNN